MNDILKEKLKKLIADKPMNYGQCCTSAGYEDIKAGILNAVPVLSSDFYSFKTRIFWILHDITEFPKCCICGKDVTQNVRTLSTGYNKNKAWEASDVFNTTCSCSACKSAKHASDVKKTCMEKYGVENVFQTEWCKNKITETCVKRSGYSRSGNSPEGRSKARQTWIDRYGVDSPLRSDSVKQRVRQTCIEKYGVDSYTKTDEYKRRHARYYLEQFLEKIKSDPEIEFLDMSEFVGLSSVNELWDTSITCKCRKCGSEFKNRLGFNNYYKYKTVSSCPVCHPSASSSKAENDLFNFMSEQAGSLSVVRNTRQVVSPYELDIYLPDRKFAIEFDGLYWHSAGDSMPPDYHLNKTEKCESQGIQLIHIFENEWEFKQDIVKSRLKNLMGIYDKTVFARKCAIREIDNKTSKNFQNENHIQGAVNAGVNIGLYFDNDLISVMTFGKSRFNKKYQWEMLRFCSKLGYHIPGAAGKMLKYFELAYEPASIISYADRRWSTGKLYKSLGFSLDHISKPDYYYWNYRKAGFKLESRIKYQKHKLRKSLKVFDENKTEVENMINNGYHQIFDCGNLVFVKNYSLN